MDFTVFVFYFLAAILLYAGLRVVTLRNPVHAALHLVLAFFSGSGLWILLQAEFLAIALVLVYVGAVMVLFLFVVMMLDINIDRLREGFWNYLPVGAIVALIIAAEMGLVLYARFSRTLESSVTQTNASVSNVRFLSLITGWTIISGSSPVNYTKVIVLLHNKFEVWRNKPTANICFLAALPMPPFKNQNKVFWIMFFRAPGLETLSDISRCSSIFMMD